jgi:tRNA dimethylallyltransferase
LAETKKYLVVLCGPTASGKTAAAIRLANHYRTEIISTDSRQIYRELNIGTAKPSESELQEAKHHFIGSRSVTEAYSAGQFEREALALLKELYQSHDVVIAAGGTGLYIRSLTEGLDDMPSIDPSIRESVKHEYLELGLEHLQREALKADPDAYATADTNNPARLLRIVEIYRATGRPKSAFTLGSTAAERPFRTIWIGLEWDRPQLYERIDRRVDEMMEAGLLEEVKGLQSFRSLNALQTVGYAELLDHLDGKLTLEEAVSLIKRNSRRYAKRQMTWFRGNPAIKWFSPADIPAMIDHIDKTMAG